MTRRRGLQCEGHFIPNTGEKGIQSLSEAPTVVTGVSPLVSEFRAEVIVARLVSLNKEDVP